MPRTVGYRQRRVQVTLCLQQDIAEELRALGASIGSQNEAARKVLGDHFRWYGLPRSMVEALSADAGPDTNQREYITDLLVRRYRELVADASLALGA